MAIFDVKKYKNVSFWKEKKKINNFGIYFCNLIPKWCYI